jgi:hypothetical protein
LIKKDIKTSDIVPLPRNKLRGFPPGEENA